MNDDDGDYGPPWPGPLPSSTLECLRCNLAYFDRSTNNAADYAIAPGAATFSNNAGDQFTVIAPPTSVGSLFEPAAELTDVHASPNPFRSIARVAFQLSERTRVRFSIRDVRGRRLLDTDEVLPAGARSLGWAGADSQGRPVPAGVYFYRLEAGSAARTGRLVLVH
jgi:hypothetical protein